MKFACWDLGALSGIVVIWKTLRLSWEESSEAFAQTTEGCRELSGTRAGEPGEPRTPPTAESGAGAFRRP